MKSAVALFVVAAVVLAVCVAAEDAESITVPKHHKALVAKLKVHHKSLHLHAKHRHRRRCLKSTKRYTCAQKRTISKCTKWSAKKYCKAVKYCSRYHKTNCKIKYRACVRWSKRVCKGHKKVKVRCLKYRKYKVYTRKRVCRTHYHRKCYVHNRVKRCKSVPVILKVCKRVHGKLKCYRKVKRTCTWKRKVKTHTVCRHVRHCVKNKCTRRKVCRKAILYKKKCAHWKFARRPICSKRRCIKRKAIKVCKTRCAGYKIRRRCHRKCLKHGRAFRCVRHHTHIVCVKFGKSYWHLYKSAVRTSRARHLVAKKSNVYRKLVADKAQYIRSLKAYLASAKYRAYQKAVAAQRCAYKAFKCKHGRLRLTRRHACSSWRRCNPCGFYADKCHNLRRHKHRGSCLYILDKKNHCSRTAQ